MKAKERDLKQVEKRAYLTWHRDGLADLGIGVLVLLFGLGMRYDMTLMAPVYGCVGYPIWLILKQRITERRLGWVAFGEARKRREKRGWTMLVGLGCVVFLLLVGGYLLVRGGSASGLPGMLLISLIFVVLASSLGMVLQLVRMQVYSGVILLAGLAGHLLGWAPETGIIVPGGIIVLSGLMLLVTFLIKYPIEGAGDELPGERSEGQDS